MLHPEAGEVNFRGSGGHRRRVCSIGGTFEMNLPDHVHVRRDEGRNRDRGTTRPAWVWLEDVPGRSACMVYSSRQGNLGNAFDFQLVPSMKQKSPLMPE